MKFVFILLLISNMALATPLWVKDSTRLAGSHYQVSCSGEGPSLDIARQESLASCRNSANDQMKTALHIQSLSVETEKDVAFHSEISKDTVVKNLKCDPKKEEIEEKAYSIKVWLLCDFDLSKVSTADRNAPVTDNNENSPNELIKNRSSVSAIPNSGSNIKKATMIEGENIQLTLTTVPQCDTILIRGQRPRSIKCKDNPQALFIYPSDLEIIIRADGHVPKHIKLNDNRKPANDEEPLEVYLEKM
jgi:hypothetical protein